MKQTLFFFVIISLFLGCGQQMPRPKVSKPQVKPEKQEDIPKERLISDLDKAFAKFSILRGKTHQKIPKNLYIYYRGMQRW